MNSFESKPEFREYIKLNFNIIINNKLDLTFMFNKYNCKENFSIRDLFITK